MVVCKMKAVIFITLMPVELIKPIFCIGLALILENKINDLQSVISKLSINDKIQFRVATINFYSGSSQVDSYGLKQIKKIVKIAKERNERYKNSSQEILIENINPKDSSQLMGRTRTNRLTFFPRSLENEEINNPGELIKVKITDIRPFSLTAKLL